MNDPKSLLPWYLNESLPAEDKSAVEQWLAADDSARTALRVSQQAARVIVSQPERVPSRKVEQKLLARVQQPAPQKSGWPAWAWGLPLAALLFVLLWLLIQPGMMLQWSVRGSEIAAFRIYRAPVGSTEFALVDELPAVPAQQTYQYADALIVPGQSYQYVVEVVDQSGSTAARQATNSNTWMALAAQLAVLLTSFMLAYGFILIVKEPRAPLLLV